MKPHQQSVLLITTDPDRRKAVSDQLIALGFDVSCHANFETVGKDLTRLVGLLIIDGEKTHEVREVQSRRPGRPILLIANAQVENETTSEGPKVVLHETLLGEPGWFRSNLSQLGLQI